MMGQTKLGPTHVCPKCGEWWDVEPNGHDSWLVSAHDNEHTLAVKVWWEEARVPVCPEDTCDLTLFNIALT